jgi:hypothetical protein
MKLETISFLMASTPLLATGGMISTCHAVDEGVREKVTGRFGAARRAQWQHALGQTGFADARLQHLEIKIGHPDMASIEMLGPLGCLQSKLRPANSASIGLLRFARNDSALCDPRSGDGGDKGRAAGCRERAATNSRRHRTLDI